MNRRLHVERLSIGLIEISQREAHHARDVLRLQIGDELEIFDDAGRCATGSIAQITPHSLSVRIDKIDATKEARRTLTIASAIPKGERADWMIEKLSELGVSRFVPLITDRSIVQPSGKNKLDRWRRIAVESAKQSRRAGLMQIDEPTPLSTALDSLANPFFLATEVEGISITSIDLPDSASLLIGPEGGWSEAELATFAAKKIPAMKLTESILRIETAAIAAATSQLLLR